MKKRTFFVVAALGLIAFAMAATGSTAGPGNSGGSLDLYTGVVSSAQLGQLARQGYEVARTAQTAGGVQADLVLMKSDVKKLAAQGIDLKPRRDKQGRTQRERAAA